MGNAFVACGVIYCINEYSSKTTTINFAYDTKTGKQWIPNIKFTNQYGYNSMVDYNPTERVLYAWDNKRLVTYPLTFEERQIGAKLKGKTKPSDGCETFLLIYCFVDALANEIS